MQDVGKGRNAENHRGRLEGNISVTEEVNHSAGFYKVGCTLISISLRWDQTPTDTDHSAHS